MAFWDSISKDGGRHMASPSERSARKQKSRLKNLEDVQSARVVLFSYEVLVKEESSCVYPEEIWKEAWPSHKSGVANKTGELVQEEGGRNPEAWRWEVEDDDMESFVQSSANERMGVGDESRGARATKVMFKQREETGQIMVQSSKQKKVDKHLMPSSAINKSDGGDFESVVGESVDQGSQVGVSQALVVGQGNPSNAAITIGPELQRATCEVGLQQSQTHKDLKEPTSILPVLKFAFLFKIHAL
ncbi:hypothetical protein RHGRI_010063 [Rhododendron griersonianum]|uniref:Uncharacterized protein n=1 Tax=Rhododendron griersonianum TaxID=479676 RepID=A0AAV6KHQ1_9ERIC|nr:hypothetical protein RHGRI_010063 [Rhododendron griersonianum]